MVFGRFPKLGTLRNSKNASLAAPESQTTALEQYRCVIWVVAVSAISMLIGQWYSLAKLPTSGKMIHQTRDWLPRRSPHYQSDVVELDHCDEVSITQTKGKKRTKALKRFAVSYPSVVKSLVQDLQQPLEDAMRVAEMEVSNETSFQTAKTKLVDEMEQEFSLQLWEMFLHEQGYCNFSAYRPTVPGHAVRGRQLQNVVQAHPNAPRLAFVISAFQDFDHLKALIRAIHQPQHCIVIHLDRQCKDEDRAQVEGILASLPPDYNNVVIVQFGSVIYTSDSISLINLRILRWLTFDLKLDYRQVLLLDGAVYPLFSPTELVQSLQQLAAKKRSVWLGRLLLGTFDYTNYDSRFNKPKPLDGFLRYQRVMFAQSEKFKLTKGAQTRGPLPKDIVRHMIYKSTSGNQGVYSRALVEKLLNHDTVMELFAFSKYSCCCCVEEHVWMAALSMLGYAREAMAHTSMFQVWGGYEDGACQTSMTNSVLSLNATLCFVIADPWYYDISKPKNETKYVTFHGNETLKFLANAKRRGVMFARKFRSQSEDSKNLIQAIEAKLWDNPDLKGVL
jgi:Core-2/I-Branching enzyme